ncbi:hypothetical protein KC953_00570 [Candidatus Saccharibacteria bacterium]|nr:hypothetical protein [Candidatus Saccharibacteria bacterium]
MAKTPWLCLLFGHKNVAHKEVVAMYQKCIRCDRVKSHIDEDVYFFEVNWWQSLAKYTQIDIAELQNNMNIRTWAWDEVSAYRNLCELKHTRICSDMQP